MVFDLLRTPSSPTGQRSGPAIIPESLAARRNHLSAARKGLGGRGLGLEGISRCLAYSRAF